MDREFRGSSVALDEGREQMRALHQAHDRGRLYTLRGRELPSDGYYCRLWPHPESPSCEVGIYAEVRDPELCRGLEDKAEGPRQAVRESFAALQKSHASSPEAKVVRDLTAQLEAAHTGLALAETKVAAHKGELRRIAREGGDHVQTLAEIKNAEGVVEVKTLLITVLEIELRDARAVYEQVWDTKLQDFVQQQREASQARADSIESGIVRNIVPALVRLQAERDGERLVTSPAFSQAQAPEVGQQS
jgi:hypothetical protein